MNKTINIKKHITDHLILHKSKSMICHIISYAKHLYIYAKIYNLILSS